MTTEVENQPKTGVLLMNTGTPDSPTVGAVSKYLKEFLMDPAIISAPFPVRYMVAVHIAAIRPKRTVKNYEKFWTPEGSPFMIASRAQAAKLQAQLDMPVALCMRYGNPTIADALKQLRDAGCQRVVILPSYPQQVNVCAGTCITEARRVLKNFQAQGWNPEVVEILSFYQQPDYQEALAQAVRDAWTYKPGSKLLVSFHSTMLADIEAGDPYKQQTEETRDFLIQKLGIPAEDVLLSYQSRFDNRKWLSPFTEAVVLDLAAQGVKDVCIVCPIFTAANTETVIDVKGGLAAEFLEAAGEGATFTHVPELDAADGLISAMAAQVRQALEEAANGHATAMEFKGMGADKTLPGMVGGHK